MSKKCSEPLLLLKTPLQFANGALQNSQLIIIILHLLLASGSGFFSCVTVCRSCTFLFASSTLDKKFLCCFSWFSATLDRHIRHLHKKLCGVMIWTKRNHYCNYCKSFDFCKFEIERDVKWKQFYMLYFAFFPTWGLTWRDLGTQTFLKQVTDSTPPTPPRVPLRIHILRLKIIWSTEWKSKNSQNKKIYSKAQCLI